MQVGTPSRTALRVALRRAAHQVYDAPPLVLDDAIAVPLLGPGYAAELARTATKLEKEGSLGLRAWVVARSRYAEDSLAAAVARGVRQYVLLGAGLDTFAHRNPHPGLRVFEVDHPDTQAWKRELLRASRILHPDGLTYVPIDFERQSLAGELAVAGHDPQRPTFFAWLGVVPYLTPPAFRETLGFIAAQPGGSGAAMDYGQPRAVLPATEQMARDSLAARVALVGEPFRLFFTQAEMLTELRGFRGGVEDLGSAEINERYFAGRPDALRTQGEAGRLALAWV